MFLDVEVGHLVDAGRPTEAARDGALEEGGALEDLTGRWPR